MGRGPLWEGRAAGLPSMQRPLGVPAEPPAAPFQIQGVGTAEALLWGGGRARRGEAMPKALFLKYRGWGGGWGWPHGAEVP